MPKATDKTFVPVSSWAVGRFPNRSQVAFKLNDLTVVMSMADAKAVAASLNSAVEEIGQRPLETRSSTPISAKK
jgi:hypothetical protein